MTEDICLNFEEKKRSEENNSTTLFFQKVLQKKKMKMRKIEKYLENNAKTDEYRNSILINF